ncbi:MAG: hypothetical protein ACRDRO_13400 [Pseudonocardiaceae bacterium]
MPYAVAVVSDGSALAHQDPTGRAGSVEPALRHWAPVVTEEAMTVTAATAALLTTLNRITRHAEAVIDLLGCTRELAEIAHSRRGALPRLRARAGRHLRAEPCPVMRVPTMTTTSQEPRG